MKKLYFLLLTILATSLFVACGGDDNEAAEPDTPTPAVQSPPVEITLLNFLKSRNPSMDRTFSFKPDESGLISGKVYTYTTVNAKSRIFPVDIRHLIPTFETNAEKLYYGDGKPIVNGSTRIDFSRPVKIKAVEEWTSERVCRRFVAFYRSANHLSEYRFG